MDDEAIYGPVFHRLPFSEAIERGLLTDYQVVVIGVDEPECREMANTAKFVRSEGIRNTDARTLAAQIGLGKAMSQYDLRRAISFHSRVISQRQSTSRSSPLTVTTTTARCSRSRAECEVYLVQHPRLSRHDALKVLRPDVSSDTSFHERFIREADLAAALRHPHIVGIDDRGEHDGQLWIVMDYMDGSDAAQLTQQRYPAGMPAELSGA
jgi:hypothetical protein